MYRILKVNPTGFYRWLKTPESPRTIENKKLTELIRFYWEESGQVYGSPNIHEDQKEAGIKYIKPERRQERIFFKKKITAKR